MTKHLQEQHILLIPIQREVDMGDKGKKDKGRREVQKKAKLTIKEKRKKKKEKGKEPLERA